MTVPASLVIFSDLDGTLLDHETYSWQAARPALRALAARKVPVVLASSKTAAEIALLQDAMGLRGQLAIVENGAGLIGASGVGDVTGDDYAGLRRVLWELPEGLRRAFRGFGDMSLQEVIAATGLAPDAAIHARKRAFSEPGVWSGSAEGKAAFLDSLEKKGVLAKQGGRFLTLSFGKTKADQMAAVIAHYRARRSIALGDAPNDIDMLERADLGVIVANPNHDPLPPLAGEAEGRIIRTRLPGPAGWNNAVLKLLEACETD
jgi:mannosyl-3-phosphoglycerate phosphatase